MKQINRICEYVELTIMCPCCSEKSAFEVMPKGEVPKVGRIIKADTEWDDMGEVQCIQQWYDGICPKCHGSFSVADRFRVVSADTVAYDYDVNEHRFDVTVEDKQGNNIHGVKV